MKISKRHPLIYNKYKDKVVTDVNGKVGIVVGYCEFGEDYTPLIAQEYLKKEYSSLMVFYRYHGKKIKDFHGDLSMSFFLFDEYSIRKGYIISAE